MAAAGVGGRQQWSACDRRRELAAIIQALSIMKTSGKRCAGLALNSARRCSRSYLFRCITCILLCNHSHLYMNGERAWPVSGQEAGEVTRR